MKHLSCKKRKKRIADACLEFLAYHAEVVWISSSGGYKPKGGIGFVPLYRVEFLTFGRNATIGPVAEIELAGLRFWCSTLTD